MATVELTEDDWQTQVVEFATLMRWMIHHDRPAQNRRGKWASHIQGDPGFPDLVLCRTGQVLFVELKTNRGILSADQMAWRDRLLVAGMDWRCWRPRHWPEVKATLLLPTYSNWREVADVDTGGRV